MSFDDLRAITAEWLRAGIKASGLSTEQVAEKAGVAKSTIYRLLGQEVTVEEGTVAALAKVLKRPFPRLEPADGSPIKSDKKGHGSPVAGRGVREPASEAYGDREDEESAYLRFTLQMTRELSAAEREGASPQVLLRLVDLAEKVAVPIHGPRAKKFLDDERERIRRGQTLDSGGDR